MENICTHFISYLCFSGKDCGLCDISALSLQCSMWLKATSASVRNRTAGRTAPSQYSSS